LIFSKLLIVRSQISLINTRGILMSILKINNLALDLVALDFSDNHTPDNGGPTKTSRALAIIHLAARDAYAKVTSTLTPKLVGLPNPPSGVTDGEAAVLGAGIRAATLLYPTLVTFINTQAAIISAGANAAALAYGASIADKWVQSRQNDNSSLPQTDTMFNDEPGHHRPDPVTKLPALGRNWGKVKPFVVSNVVTDAPLAPPPKLTDAAYGTAFDDVFVNGRDDITERNAHFRKQATIGIYWGYDGANKLGTPPRLYNKFVVAAADFQKLSSKDKINVLAAINAAMADAGIAAWHWKYAYDFWRPIVAIREADKGFGPTGKGDGNTDRNKKGDPFWLPLGAPKSNPLPPLPPADPNLPSAYFNFTPNFPAYPSGHSTFGSACFETFAALIGKPTDRISVTFVSSEFNGITTDNNGITRPKWSQTLTLKEALEQNAISRIYLGVHWSFDATGGETVGKAIAVKTVAAFK
jgi:membrane-associated phospholipid phosphatase